MRRMEVFSKIELARALFSHAGVLILDDCPSAVDESTEAEIIRALVGGPLPCTRGVVGQRVGTVVRAERVGVLEDGLVSAGGSHADLSRTSPI